MSSVADNISVVWSYNKSAVQQWEVYDPAMPPVLNSLKTIVPGKGYWIYANADVEWTYEVISTDSTPPLLSITSPTNGATVTTSTITIEGIALDNTAIASVIVNGITATGTTSWDVDLTLSEGTNTITAIATDTSGNTATNTITITYTPTAGIPSASGTVVETMNSAGYTYVKIDTGSGEVWAAGPETVVNVGDNVSVSGGLMMGFYSSSLDKTFDEIIFTDVIEIASSSIPT